MNESINKSMYESISESTHKYYILYTIYYIIDTIFYILYIMYYNTVLRDNFPGLACWGYLILSEFQNQFCCFPAISKTKMRIKIAV